MQLSSLAARTIRALRRTSRAPDHSATAIVFSKDRPLQVDATLRSLSRHCSDADALVINVLYTTSSRDMEALYAVVRLEHPRVNFIREQTFKRDVVGLMAKAAAVLFSVDDTLFVREFSVATTIEQLADDADAIAFSLRLGRNTTYCYPMDARQEVPEFEERGAGILAYRWPGASHDFGYPLELSSSIYRVADIMPLVRRMRFANPNSFEEQLAAAAGSLAAIRPTLLCLERSAAFSVPLNLVQAVTLNRAATGVERSFSALASAFRDGVRVDVARYDDFPNVGCHEEVDLQFLPGRVNHSTR